MSLPQRKHPRLKNYDYSTEGCYYVTIHTRQQEPLLSTVGRGLAPAEAAVALTPIGTEAVCQLRMLEERYPYVHVENYVIMPTHIHLLLRFDGQTAGASPRPTLSDVICAYKSLTTRSCNRIQNTPGRKLFQSSFFERVIRNETGFLKAWEYIDGNPGRWLERAQQECKSP